PAGITQTGSGPCEDSCICFTNSCLPGCFAASAVRLLRKQMTVPPERVQACNGREVAAGDYVLYWMVANRRRNFNFALQRAVEWSVELRKPLLIVEALGCRHRWATARSHLCIMQGMLDNARAFRGSGVAYHPYVERGISDGKGMIYALAEHSSIV